jgi:hypothetical protein
MLLTKEQVIAAMSLTAVDVMDAFARYGYVGERLKTAEFRGYTTGGSFTYNVTFNWVDETLSDTNQTAIAYLSFDGFGKLIAEY